METAQRKIEREQVALSRIQKEVADFKNRLLVLYKQHLELISSLPADEEEAKAAPAPEEEAPAPAPAQELVEGSDDYYDEESPAELPAEEAEEEPPVEEEPRRRESKYGNLMFGDEFDFSRNP